jgi:hypothetical protein
LKNISSIGERIAFKEWAVIVDRLGTGAQIVILRKGGIHEKRGGFEVEHKGFFLFPTLFHQQRESVVAEARPRCDEVLPAYSDKSRVRIEFWAEALEARRVTDWARLARLAPLHVWTEDVVKDRFGWGKENAIFVIATRVYRLAEPRTLPVLEKYGGCKSWIELDAGAAPSLEGKRPVLADAEFEKKLRAVREALD